MSTYFTYFLLIIVLVTVVYSDTTSAEYQDDTKVMDDVYIPSDYFLRSAKWVSKMSPSGGSLVSGRGGFRPGFVSRDWRHALAEPNFVKRSSSPDYY